jgi:hypothetical protein
VQGRTGISATGVPSYWSQIQLKFPSCAQLAEKILANIYPATRFSMATVYFCQHFAVMLTGRPCRTTFTQEILLFLKSIDYFYGY